MIMMNVGRLRMTMSDEEDRSDEEANWGSLEYKEDSGVEMRRDKRV